MQEDGSRPTVPERFKQHMVLSELIRRLKKEYRERPNENMRAMLELAEQLKEFFWIEKIIYVQMN